MRAIYTSLRGNTKVFKEIHCLVLNEIQTSGEYVAQIYFFKTLFDQLYQYINISIYQYNLCSCRLQFTSSFFIWLAIIEIDSYEALTDESHKKDGQDFLARSSLLIFTVLHIIFCYQLTSHILTSSLAGCW